MATQERTSGRHGRSHRRRSLGLAISVAVMGALLALAATRLDLAGVGRALGRVRPGWVIVALVLMAGSFVARAESWYATVAAALPAARVSRAAVLRGLLIGMAGSAVAPGRLGEAARAWLVARRLGPPGRTVGVIVGTLVSQTLLNVLALVLLALIALSGGALTTGRLGALAVIVALPAGLLMALLAGPRLLVRAQRSPRRRVSAVAAWSLGQVVGIRRGLRGFGHLRSGAHAISAQLLGWALQAGVCFVTLLALRLDAKASVALAAAVLVAVNVTAVFPVTPSNVGVFQAACIAVLAGFGISASQGLAYGLVLQAVEVAVDLGLGIPALLREGATWSEIRRAAQRTRGEAPAPGTARREPETLSCATHGPPGASGPGTRG